MTDFLVTGASGHLGQRVLHHLLETLKVAPSRITAASRSPAKLATWKVRGVHVVEADFDDPASLAKAFSGVKRLLVVSTDAMDVPGKRLSQHQAAIRAAEAAGVSHVVYTSLPDAEKSLVSFAPDHHGTEQALAKSAIKGWTVLRNNWYSENLLHSLPQALHGGVWYSAAQDGRIAYINRDDLALAAATALASDFDGKRTLTLAGDKSYTSRDVAELARKATGRKLDVVDVPVDGLVQGMVGAGLPELVARTFTSFDAAAAAGNLDGTAADFRALTGRAPAPFLDWFSTVAVPALAAKAA